MEIAKDLLRKLTVTSMNRDASSSQQHRILAMFLIVVSVTKLSIVVQFSSLFGIICRL